MSSAVPCRRMFTDTLLELGKKDKDIIAVTSDARGSVTLDKFANELPEQFVEVGIAEQDSVGIGAGLAACGKKPFVCGPACFLSMRSIEQVKVDVGYAGTNVKIIGVSGGVSYGALGTSHHSLQDIAIMRAIPGMTVILPCDANQTRKMTEALVNYAGPAYVRMGRNAVPDVYTDEVSFEIGKANLLMDGEDLTLIATGETVRHAPDAAILLKQKGISARVLDMHTLKPLDNEAIINAAKDTKLIISIEEHSVNGGLGAAISQVVSENYPIRVKTLGIPDQPVIAGTSLEVFDYYGLTGQKICNTALELINL